MTPKITNPNDGDDELIARVRQITGRKAPQPTPAPQIPKPANPFEKAAKTLGVDPVDLATIVSFETGGTFDPDKVGGEGNKYRGAIQFGVPEQKLYYRPGQTLEEQLNDGVVRYFQDRFKKVGKDTRGATLEDLYTTVIAGNPLANRDAKDAFGTSARTGVEKMRREHRQKVLEKFFGGVTPTPAQISALSKDDEDLVSRVRAMSGSNAPDLNGDDAALVSRVRAMTGGSLPPTNTLTGNVVGANREYLSQPAPDVTAIIAPSDDKQPPTIFDKQGNAVKAVGGEEPTLNQPAPTEPTPGVRVPELDNFPLNAFYQAKQKIQDRTEIGKQFRTYLDAIGVKEPTEQNIKDFNDIQRQTVENANRANQQVMQSGRTVQEPQPVPEQTVQDPTVPTGISAGLQTQFSPVSLKGITYTGAKTRFDQKQFVKGEVARAALDKVRGAMGIDVEAALKRFPLPDPQGDIKDKVDIEIDADFLKTVAEERDKRIWLDAKQNEAVKLAKQKNIPLEEARFAVGLIDYKGLEDARKERSEDVRKDAPYREKYIRSQFDTRAAGQSYFGQGFTTFDYDTAWKQAQSDADEVLKEYGSFERYYNEQREMWKRIAANPNTAALEFTKNLARSAPKIVSSIFKVASIAGEAIDTTVGGYGVLGGLADTREAKDRELYRFGKWLDRKTDEFLPQDEQLKKSFLLTTLPDTVGQLFFQLGAGVATGGIAAPLLIGGAAGAVEQYEEADKFNADRKTKLFAAALGGLLSVPDAIPFAKWLKPLSKAERAGFLSKMLNSFYSKTAKELGEKEALSVTRQLARNVWSGFKFEGTQELSEKKGNDLFASLTYDPKRKVLVVSGSDIETFVAGGIGGMVGGGVETVLTNTVADERPQADIAPEQQKKAWKAEAENRVKNEIIVPPINKEPFVPQQTGEKTETPKTAPTKAEQVEYPEGYQPSQVITKLEAQIADLKAKRDEAVQSGDTQKVRQFDKQIGRAEQRLERRRSDAQIDAEETNVKAETSETTPAPTKGTGGDEIMKSFDPNDVPQTFRKLTEAGYIPVEAGQMIEARMAENTEPSSETSSPKNVKQLNETKAPTEQIAPSVSESKDVFSDVAAKPDAQKPLKTKAYRVGDDRRDTLFTSKTPDYVTEYADTFGVKGDIKEVDIDFKNPLRVTLSHDDFTDRKKQQPFIDKARNEGYDGVVFTPEKDSGWSGEEFYVKLAKPSEQKGVSAQVKSENSLEQKGESTQTRKESATKIADWENKLAKYKRLDGNYKKAVEDLRKTKASLALGRNFGESFDSFLDRKGLREFNDWATNKISELENTLPSKTGLNETESKSDFIETPSPNETKIKSDFIEKPTEFYSRRVNDKGGQSFTVETKAKQQKIEGYDSFEFFIHKDTETGVWKLSEAKTGLELVKDTSRAGLIGKAKGVMDSRLNFISKKQNPNQTDRIEQLQRLVEKEVGKFGTSPRYAPTTKTENKIGEIENKNEGLSHRLNLSPTERATLRRQKDITSEELAEKGVKPLGEKGNFGQVSFKLRSGMTAKDSTLLKDLADTFAPDVDIADKNAPSAVLDAMAEIAGKDRSSQLSPKDWQKILESNAHKMTDESIDSILGALTHQAEWQKKIDSFTSDERLLKLESDKPLESFKEFKELPLAVRKQILAIGREYDITDDSIKTAFNKTLSQYAQGESRVGESSTDAREAQGEGTGESETEVAFTRAGGKDSEINLENLHKDYENTKNVAERIRSGELKIEYLDNASEQGRISGGQRNVEASLILAAEAATSQRASTNDGARLGSHSDTIRRQEQILERYAKENDIWFKPGHFPERLYVGRGGEALVYEKDQQRVVKLIDYRHIDKSLTPLKFINNRISLFNYLFPESHYELMGFMRDGAGKFRFIVTQPFIEGRGTKTQADIDTMMQSRGFERTGRESYSNALYQVHDLHVGNVIKDANGNIFVIDAVPKFNVEPLPFRVAKQGITDVSGDDAVFTNAEDIKRHKIQDKLLAKNLTDLSKQSLRDIAPDAKFEYDAENDILTVNPEGATIFRKAFESRKGEDVGGFFGFYAHPTAAGKLVEAIGKLKAEAKAKGDFRTVNVLSRLEKMMEAAMDNGHKDLTVVIGGQRLVTKLATQEEMSHRADFRLRDFKQSVLTPFQSLDSYQEAYKNVEKKGYSNPVEIHNEIVAKSFRDDATDQLGIDEAGIKEIQRTYAKSLRDAGKTREEIIEAFENLTPRAKEFTENVRKENRPDTRTDSTDGQKIGGQTARSDGGVGQGRTTKTEKRETLAERLNRFAELSPAETAYVENKLQTAPKSERDVVKLVKDEKGRLLAPNGRPSNLNENLWRTVRTPSFKKWFGSWDTDPQNASKVVDENGEPLVVYHGTAKKFDNFDPNAKALTDFIKPGEQGFFFTPDEGFAEGYAESAVDYFNYHGEPHDGMQVVKVFLSLQNPLIVETNENSPVMWFDSQPVKWWQKEVINKSFDGAIIRGVEDPLFIASKPNQIKSIFNQGTFDALKDEIMFAKAYDVDTRTSRGVDAALDIVSGFKSIKATGDLSAAGRQGWVLALTHPRMAARAFNRQILALNDKKYDEFVRNLNLHPYIELAEDSGLFLATLADESSLTEREESFMSRLFGNDLYFSNKKAEKGRRVATYPVRKAENAYKVFLDDLRIQAFAHFARQVSQRLKKKGASQDEFTREMKGVARFVNYATGRGEWSSPTLNATFFSTRYWESRVQLMNPVFYGKLPPTARRLALKNMAGFVGATALLLLLFDLIGDVEWDDIDDPGALKVKIGNYSYDISSGIVGNLRFFARLVMATQDKQPVSEMGRLTGRYVRSKLSPVPGAVVSGLDGKNFVGEPTSWKEEGLDLLTPLQVKSFYEAAKADGSLGLIQTLPEFFGIGTSRFKTKSELQKEAKQEENKMKSARTPADKKEAERRLKLWNNLIKRKEENDKKKK